MATELSECTGKQIALDVEPIGNRYRWSFAINGGPLHVGRDDPMRPGLPCVRKA